MTEPSREALEAAREAVEAIPSHLFLRGKSEPIAQAIAPDFDAFAAAAEARASKAAIEECVKRTVQEMAVRSVMVGKPCREEICRVLSNLAKELRALATPEGKTE